MKMSRCNTMGFTLIEMTVVLAIIGLLLGGMMMPLSAQTHHRRVSETQKTLEEINQALMGFAIVNGRLPCPASLVSNGAESPAGGICTNPYDGFIPAVALGLNQIDAQGYAIDAWGTRIRYAVTTANASAFTTTDGIRSTGFGGINPDLRVCASATGIAAANCGAAQSLTSNAPAIVLSLGKNATAGGGGLDEAANLNGDAVFIYHTQSEAGPSNPNGEFDDLVIWLSSNVLFNRMVAAGKLP